MNRKPLVSVITPSYNAENYIKDTIESVRNQTYQDWELVIADDCSTDRTRQIIEEYTKKDDRIRGVFLKENGGAAVARNSALEAAKGRYVAFLDSDDQWRPEKMERQLEFMKKNNYAFTFTGYDSITQSGKLLVNKIDVPEVLTYDDVLKNTIIGCLTVMLDRDQVGDVKMPNIRTRQDLATWLSILKRGFKAYGLNESLAIYRIVENSISRNKWKAAQKTWFVYREIEHLHLLKASWCFIHYAKNAVKKRL
ncbi:MULTISPECIES: teichuronic acid biosynthesis protein TuaG [Bacillus]|uniref:Glycosyl transferase n=2 Tax=Bacillus TaxID=1386 RepID=A0A0M4FI39_9BACI|nr:MULTISPECIES: glycosyltransferase family 2 protein [Bacillus]ALC82511.1 glycosyl transferase [Bacillus gobiensis]MBP1081412.1 teichuronic acid biosynthesis glycosyltransferase TuaG [Bacillus capparidis]MED1096084.1 glycosyltransferase family 2 protein [Bacillus capparidis]